MKKLLLLTVMFIGLSSKANTNSKIIIDSSLCSISGLVTDKANSELIPFASLVLQTQNGDVIATTQTDFDGKYSFKSIKAGVYNIKVSYVGYNTNLVKGVKLKNGKATNLNIYLEVNQTELKEVVIQQYTKPIATYDRKKMESLSNKSLIVRGSRSPGLDYNTEEYSRINDNEFKSSKNEPLSTFSIDVDKASYSNVRRFINEGSLPPADAVRVEEMINYFNYNYPQPKSNEPFSITTQYTDCPWNSKHQLIHIGMQAKQIAIDNLPPNNLVFLLDVSGSMSDANKLPLLKSGLNLLIEQMRPQDKIAIVVYAGAAGVVLEPTSGKNKNKIIDALEKLEAGGSTAGGEGIQLAYKTAKANFDSKANNRVILATDGDFNVGVSSDGELTRLIEEERKSGVYLSVLGLGTGNLKDSRMEQLADKGNGNYAYIDNILEAKKVLVKEMGGTLLTIAKDVKLQIEFNPAYVKGYRLVGYENRLLNNEDFNDDKKDAGELGSGHTVTAIYEIIPAGSNEAIASVDSLKYQSNNSEPKMLIDNNEVMTIKFRYKEPKDSTSKLLSHIVYNNKLPFSSASENCRFACSVAQFGMLLRDSKFKGDASFKNVIAQAKESKGTDDEGYRAEFIKLVEMAELLGKQVKK